MRVGAAQLISRGQQGRGGTSRHLGARKPLAPEKPEFGDAESRPFGEQQFAGPGVLSRGPYVGSRGDRLQDFHLAQSCSRKHSGALLHDDGRGTFRHCGASHDARRFAWTQRAAGRLTCVNCLHHAQTGHRPRDVRRPHRVAVHARIVERRLGESGPDVLRQRPSERLLEWNPLGGHRRAGRENSGLGLFDAE